MFVILAGGALPLISALTVTDITTDAFYLLSSLFFSLSEDSSGGGYFYYFIRESWVFE